MTHIIQGNNYFPLLKPKAEDGIKRRILMTSWLTSVYQLYSNFEVYVAAETIINPSEDPIKVVTCLINTVNGGSPEINEEGNLATVETDGIHALHHIRVGVKSRFSAGVLRRMFEYNRSSNKTWFLLNKQAAYSAVVAIVESSVESSLGPIIVTITSRDLDRVLKWLVPINENKLGIKANRTKTKEKDPIDYL
jgi:uncharacterized protein